MSQYRKKPKFQKQKNKNPQAGAKKMKSYLKKKLMNKTNIIRKLHWMQRIKMKIECRRLRFRQNKTQVGKMKKRQRSKMKQLTMLSQVILAVNKSREHQSLSKRFREKKLKSFIRTLKSRFQSNRLLLSLEPQPGEKTKNRYHLQKTKKKRKNNKKQQFIQS